MIYRNSLFGMIVCSPITAALGVALAMWLWFSDPLLIILGGIGGAIIMWRLNKKG